MRTTDKFVVTGQVSKELEIKLSDLDNYSSQQIDDLIITNHKGEPRDTLRQMKGILLKELLDTLELKESNPKLYSEFYLVFIASDGYKVVYSWNELFNAPTGDHVFVVTSKAGQSAAQMKERLLVITPTDYRTGRRHIKSLSQIRVERVN